MMKATKDHKDLQLTILDRRDTHIQKAVAVAVAATTVQYNNYVQDEHKLCYHLTIIIATCASQQHCAIHIAN